MPLQPPQLADAPATRANPPHGEPVSSAGRIRRRRALPSGRALLGALLITVAASGAFLVAGGSGGRPDTSYVVASRSVHAGEPLLAGDTRLEAALLPDDVSAQAFSDPGSLDGAVALAPMLPGQLIDRSDVLLPGGASDAPISAQEYSFRLPRDHAVNGALLNGELVDVLATYGTGERMETWVVARDALVTAVEAGDDRSLGDTEAITITLAVEDEATVLRLVHATDSAVVTLVRATRGTGLSDGPERYPGPGQQ